MSHFYGTMDGGRKPASLTGHKAGGISAHLRGWGYGVEVEVTHEDGVDVARVYETGGSNSKNPRRLVWSSPMIRGES